MTPWVVLGSQVSDLTGGGGAVRHRVEVEGQHQMSGAVSGGIVNGQAGDEVIHPTVNRIKRDARQR